MGKIVRRVRVEWVEGVNAHNTASNPSTAPSRMRQQSIHVPLFFTKGRGKKSESKESSSERKTKIKSEGAEKR